MSPSSKSEYVGEHMVCGTEYLTGFLRILVQSVKIIVPAKFRRFSE